MSKRKDKYILTENSDEESYSEESFKRPTPLRTNKNAPINSSSFQDENEDSSEEPEETIEVPQTSDVLDPSGELAEYESNSENIHSFTRQHTLTSKNDKHKIMNGDIKKRGKVNSLLGALSRRKAMTIREMNAAKNVLPEQKEVEFSEATGLSIEQQEILNNSKLLFRYNDNWRVYWDMLVMLMAVWNWFIIPVQIALKPNSFDSIWFIFINGLIDVMFAIDIFIVFRTTYVDPYSGEEVLNGKKIARNYWRGRFWIDLLATIPFDTIGELIFAGDTGFLQAFGILKLIRISRLGRIISYLNMAEDIKIILKLVKLIFFLIMYIHLVGCMWYWMVDQDEKWLPPLDYVYVTTTFFQDSIAYKYWMSVYHSVLLLTGNDIGPRYENIQVIYWAVFITFGAIVNAYIFGELVVLVAVMNAKTSQFVSKLDTWNTAMENQNLSKDLRTEVVGYLAYTRSMLDSQQELETFLSLVSPSLKEKVIKEIFSEILSSNKIFKGRERLIDILTRKLITHIYQPEEIIITQGDDGDKIFFIASGGCNVYVRNRHGQK